MSNLGLEHALRKLGIDFKRAAVGDRYVMEMLIENNWVLGGESSGHIICLDRTTTGDGIISALQVLAAIIKSGKSLAELKKGMKKYPQCMVNVPIKEKVDISSCQPLQQAMRDVENTLSDSGRILVRASGTEPLLRVMVEGTDSHVVTDMANKLADVVRAELA
jgi:phosphoglucosamine mutase